MLKLEVPNLPRWRAGEPLTAEMMNQIREAMEFGLEPPQVEVYQTSTQSVANNTWTIMNFGWCRVDTTTEFGTYMWKASTPAHIYIRVPGYYVIDGQVNWASDSNYGRHVIDIDWSDSGGRWGTYETMAPLGTYGQRTTFEKWLNVGDWIKLRAWQNSGGAISTQIVYADRPCRRTALKVRWSSM